MPNSKYRFMILKIVMAVMVVAIFARLFELQIIDGRKYLETANARLSTSVTTKAPRGDILDCYGNPLVGNKVGYSVVIRKSDIDNDELNNVISKVVEILYTTGSSIDDSLPISETTPYSFTFEDKNNSGSTDDEKEQWFESNKYIDKYINSSMSADDVMYTYQSIYGVSGSLYDEHIRRIIGVRYEAGVNGYSASTPVTIATDIDISAVTQLKELRDYLPGIDISEDYVRTYNYPGLATHILGRVGKISSEEYEANSSKGYGINDIIGKQGIERWAEEYLRGKDGMKGTSTNIDGEDVELIEEVDPVPGNYIMLTIDKDLQETLEKSLESKIKSIGNDCNAGAAVVLDVNRGDCLAMAS